MSKAISVLTLVLISLGVSAQDYQLGIRLSNNVTGLPVSSYPSLFYSNLNPGAEIGLSRQFNTNQKHQWHLSGNIGFFYHRFIQTGIKIYPSIHYHYQVNPKFKIESSIDLGYLMAINNVAVLELGEDGFYENKPLNKARSQFMAGFRIGASYHPSGDPAGIAYTCAFGTFMQGPYVSGYVPLLPYNTFSVGLELPIDLKSN